MKKMGKNAEMYIGNFGNFKTALIFEGEANAVHTEALDVIIRALEDYGNKVVNIRLVRFVNAKLRQYYGTETREGVYYNYETDEKYDKPTTIELNTVWVSLSKGYVGETELSISINGPVSKLEGRYAEKTESSYIARFTADKNVRITGSTVTEIIENCKAKKEYLNGRTKRCNEVLADVFQIATNVIKIMDTKDELIERISGVSDIFYDRVGKIAYREI